MPEEVRNFIWRACQNIVPNAARLNEKIKGILGTCSLCLSERESIIHTLLGCPDAAMIWFTANINFAALDHRDVCSWMFTISQRGKKDMLEKWAVICWELWKDRNNIVFNGKYSHPSTTISKVVHELELFIAAKSTTPNIAARVKFFSMWRPPVCFPL